MILFEVICELMESLTSPDTCTCTEDPKTISDVLDCAKAHGKIEKGNGKNISPFIKYAEHINELNNRKTVAARVSVPFIDQIRACVTSKNTDDK